METFDFEQPSRSLSGPLLSEHVSTTAYVYMICYDMIRHCPASSPGDQKGGAVEQGRAPRRIADPAAVRRRLLYASGSGGGRPGADVADAITHPRTHAHPETWNCLCYWGPRPHILRRRRRTWLLCRRRVCPRPPLLGGWMLSTPCRFPVASLTLSIGGRSSTFSLPATVWPQSSQSTGATLGA